MEADDALMRWALTCRLLGVPDATIAAESEGRLTVADLPERLDERLMLLLKRMQWQNAVRRQIERVGRWGRTVQRRTTPRASTFFDEHYATGRPVVLTDFAKAWPARKKWTSAYLKARCGDAEVKVVHQREKTWLYDAKAVALSETMRFSDFVDWVDAHPKSNDRYLVGNNDALSNPLVKTLLKDCPYDRTYFDPKREVGRAYLWYGPGGTLTPLHHDTVNIILTQLRGTKHFTLISPAHEHLLVDTLSFYSLLDFAKDQKRHPALKNANVLSCRVGPGESIFIPAGWWHEVRSESVSLSLTLTNFRNVPNDYEALNPIGRSGK